MYKRQHLYIRSNVDGDDNGNIYIQAKSGENSIVCNDDDSVQLYNDNTVRLETTGGGNSADGIRIRGNSTNSSINMATADANTRGTIYANSSNQIGFLNSAGNWVFRTESSGITRIGTNGYQLVHGNNNRNLKYISGDTTSGNDIGISGYNGAGDWRFQLYGTGGSYGFLDANWASWDIKKNVNGEFQVDEGSGLQRVWNAGNDGSGSGLDADTLDGVQGASFLRSDATDTCSGQITHTNKVIIDHNSSTMLELKPQNSSPWVIGINRDDLDQSRVFVHNTNGLGWVFEHRPKFYNSGSYDNFLTTGDEGSGNGLDADTLDGYQAVDLPFLRSDTTDAQTSGSMTFGRGGVDPDSFSASSGGFGNIGDGSGWGASGVFVHGGGTGDAAAMAHNGSALFFGIQDGANTNSMETWLQVTPGTRVINFSTDNTSNGVRIGGNTVWHAGNDGSGSSLDADLLDGSQKSAFVLNNQNSGYILKFGSGSNTGNTSSSYAYAIFQEGGAWSSPYPDLRINYHTGIVLAANASYGGIRFQRDYNLSLIHI